MSTVLHLVHNAPSTTAKQQNIAMALGAARAIEEVDRQFECELADELVDIPACNRAAVTKKCRRRRSRALRWLRNYFRDRGVAFTAGGRPLLSSGALGNVDLVTLHRTAIVVALDAFCSLIEALELVESGCSAECLIEEAWQAQAVNCSGDGYGPFVGLVVALDPTRGLVSLSRLAGRGGQVTLPERHENELGGMLHEQHPAGWSATAAVEASIV